MSHPCKWVRKPLLMLRVQRIWSIDFGTVDKGVSCFKAVLSLVCWTECHDQVGRGGRINQEVVPGVELCFSGNLLVLRDGRVGYIDFGIVGRVQPSMWAAVEALLGAAAARDYVTMARALCTLGVTATDVDIPVRAPAAPPTGEVAGGRQTWMMI